MTEPDRPLVTFFLFAYNQESFVREAIEGAFRQTYSPLEIILSDDCSTDRTFEIIREMAAGYRGPHALRLNRNERNLGLGAHVNRCMELAQGELIVGGAADDVSLPQRTEAIVRAWEKSGRRACSIYSAYTIVDEHGLDYGECQQPPADAGQGLLKLCSEWKVGVAGVTHAWHRSVFDQFGPMNDDIVYEDQVVPVRSRLIGTIAYITEPLVRYRRVAGAITMPRQDRLSVGAHLRRVNTVHLDRQMAVYRQWLADFQKSPSAPAGYAPFIESLMARARFDRAMQEDRFLSRFQAFCVALKDSRNAGYALRRYPRHASRCLFDLWNRLKWKGDNWQQLMAQRRRDGRTQPDSLRGIPTERDDSEM